MSNDTEVEQKFSAPIGAVAGRDVLITYAGSASTDDIISNKQTETKDKELLTQAQRRILHGKVKEAGEEFSSRFESVEKAQMNLWSYVRAKLHHKGGVDTWFRYDFDKAEAFIELWRSSFENERKCSRLIGLLCGSPYKKQLEEQALILFGEKQFNKLKFDELQILAAEHKKLLETVEVSVISDQDQEILMLKEELNVSDSSLNQSRILVKWLQNENDSLLSDQRINKLRIKILQAILCFLIAIFVIYFLLSF